MATHGNLLVVVNHPAVKKHHGFKPTRLEVVPTSPVGIGAEIDPELIVAEAARLWPLDMGKTKL
jgi:hypothetical protein